MRFIAARSLSLAALFALSLASAAARADDRQWINPAGGTFSDPMNWLGGVAPLATDNVIFDTVGQFSVTFSSDTLTKRLTVRGGSLPTFSLAGKTYEPTSIVVGDASSTSRLTVAGATLHAFDTKVGPESGGVGELVISGPGSLFRGGLKVGGSTNLVAGAGAVRVENGGFLEGVTSCILGNRSGGAGSLVIDGAHSEAYIPSGTSLDGISGSGKVDIAVTGGGKLTSGLIRCSSYTHAAVRAEGPGSSVVAIGSNTGSIEFLDQSAAGEFRVADGASVSTVTMKLFGQDADGHVANGTVTGAESLLTLYSGRLGYYLADCNFAVSDGGTLRIRYRGDQTLDVDSPIGGVGEFRVTGAGSFVNIDQFCLVRFGTRPESFARVRIMDGGVIRPTPSMQPSGFEIDLGYGEMEIRGKNSALTAVEQNNAILLVVGAVQPYEKPYGFGRLIVADGGRVFTPGNGQCCGGGIALLGGEIRGDGILGEFVYCNGGVMRPGDPYGALTVEGIYTQTSAGALEIELVDAERNQAPDRLIVTGTATLAGTLQVRMVDDFDPPIGAVFPAISAGSIVGTFDTIDAPLKNNKVAHVEYKADAVNIRIALQGDVNADGVTNAFDLSMLFSLWGTNDPTADLNADGIVNSQDLGLLLGAWSH